MCVSDAELGKPLGWVVRTREAVRLTEGVGRLDEGGMDDGPREERSGCAEDGYRIGLGVTLRSIVW